jgi:hypothetical protein
MPTRKSRAARKARGTKEIDAEMAKLRKDGDAIHQKLRVLKRERDAVFAVEDAERPRGPTQEIGG